MGRLQNSARDQGRLDPVSNLVQESTRRPVQFLDHQFDGWQFFFQGVGKSGSLTKENQMLREKLAAMQSQQKTIDRLSKENADLRALIQLPNYGRKKIYADITKLFEYDNRITISAGKKQGVAPELPVVSAGGLIGVVSTVDEETSQVLLISSPHLVLSALVDMQPLVQGLVRGSSRERMFMDIVENVEVEIGADVITTGYSRVIPRGIKIGTVTEFYKDVEFGTRKATILPSAKIGLNREVFVLK